MKKGNVVETLTIWPRRRKSSWVVHLMVVESLSVGQSFAHDYPDVPTLAHSWKNRAAIVGCMLVNMDLTLGWLYVVHLLSTVPGSYNHARTWPGRVSLFLRLH